MIYYFVMLTVAVCAGYGVGRFWRDKRGFDFGKPRYCLVVVFPDQVDMFKKIVAGINDSKNLNLHSIKIEQSSNKNYWIVSSSNPNDFYTLGWTFCKAVSNYNSI